MPFLETTRRPLRVLFSLTALTALAVSACKPNAEGAGPVDKQARKAARAERLGTNQRRQAVRGSRLGMRAEAMRAGGGRRGGMVTETAEGFIVKGTDLLTFWPCDKQGYYFMVTAPSAMQRIAQDYKFAAPKPYLPMYAQLKLAYVDDTLTQGSKTFPRYATVGEYTQRPRSEAKCAAPKRQVLSDEMQRLEGFRTELLVR